MIRTIFFFTKVFEQKKHADAMLDGKLYINRLSYFQKIEEEKEFNRRDKHEGVVSWLQPEQVILKINDHELNPKDLVSPISVQMNHHSNLNVFCIYAAHNGEFESLTEESLPKFKKQIELPKKSLKLGKHAIIVLNSREFTSRVVKAVQKKGYGMTAKLVDYYDPDEFHGHFTEEEAIFKKRIEFQHQSEYRFAINTCLQEEKPITLKIGNIRDIAHYSDVSEINKGLNIKLPEPENA